MCVLCNGTVRVEIFEGGLISRFSWVADDTKIIHVEGGITTREIFYIRQNLELHENFHPYGMWNQSDKTL